MANICENCGEVIKSLPFKCKRCNKVLCVDCRLPEKHKRFAIPIGWKSYSKHKVKLRR